MKYLRKRIPQVPSTLSYKLDEAAVAETAAHYRAGKWTRRVIRPLAIALVVTSLVNGMIVLLATVTLEPRWYRLIPFLFLIAIESIYTTIWLRDPQRLSLDRNIYRAAELLLIVVLTRALTWIIFGEGWPDQYVVGNYLRNPFALFAQGNFLISLVFVIITWRVTIYAGNIFTRLGLSDYEIRYYSLPLSVRKVRGNDQPIQTSRNTLTENFLKFWLWGGVLLAACAAFSTIEINPIVPGDMLPTVSNLGLPPLLLASLLIYFLVGFWLLSEARLATMNARWLINSVTKNPGVERNWHRYSLLMLLGVALLAAFLPIGSTFPIARIVELFLMVVLFGVQLIVFAFALIVALLLSIFPASQAAEVPPLPPPDFSQMIQDSGQAAEPISDTTIFLFSSAFWSIFAVVVVLALLFFLRERGYRLNRESTQSAWQGLRHWLVELWHRLRNRMQDVNLNWQLRRLAADEGADTAVSSKKRRWRFIRVNALSPRDQIRYFYLSTVRRAGDKGVKRESSLTPLEYADDLSENWPDSTEEIEELTDAFLKARYSVDPIKKDDINPVKKTWKEVKRTLRKRAKPEADVEEDNS